MDWKLTAGILLVLASRAALVYGLGPLLRMQGRALPRDWRHVLFLGGLRGAVPAALILLTPADYVYRQEMLAMVFMLVGYSVIVHPLLLKQYLVRYPASNLPSAGGEPAGGLDAVTRELPPALAHGLRTSAWGLAAIAGVIAGIVFLVLEMLMVPLFMGGSPWAPVRMIAAIGLGPGVLPPPASFAFDVLLVAMVVHFTLSLVYAWMLAPFLNQSALLKAMLLGMLGGLVIYLVNFYLFTALFPWFANARTWITIVAHLVFGGVLSTSYVFLRYHDKQCP